MDHEGQAKRAIALIRECYKAGISIDIASNRDVGKGVRSQVSDRDRCRTNIEEVHGWNAESAIAIVLEDGHGRTGTAERNHIAITISIEVCDGQFAGRSQPAEECLGIEIPSAIVQKDCERSVALIADHEICIPIVVKVRSLHV